MKSFSLKVLKILMCISAEEVLTEHLKFMCFATGLVFS